MVCAYVNWGRWLADCPSCNSAEVLRVGQDTFVCSIDECRFTDSVLWPASLEDIEGLLLKRRLKNRNWVPEESLNVLRAENLFHHHELIREG